MPRHKFELNKFPDSAEKRNEKYLKETGESSVPPEIKEKHYKEEIDELCEHLNAAYGQQVYLEKVLHKDSTLGEAIADKQKYYRKLQQDLEVEKAKYRALKEIFVDMSKDLNSKELQHRLITKLAKQEIIVRPEDL